VGTKTACVFWEGHKTVEIVKMQRELAFKVGVSRPVLFYERKSQGSRNLACSRTS
jgi:hypothetical protein